MTSEFSNENNNQNDNINIGINLDCECLSTPISQLKDIYQKNLGRKSGEQNYGGCYVPSSTLSALHRP